MIIQLVLLAFAARGFDCSKASLPSEKAICASSELKALDQKLNAVYSAKRRSAKDATALKSAQTAWVASTRTCKSDAACLKAKYEKRIAELGAAGISVGGASGGAGAVKSGGGLSYTVTKSSREVKKVSVTREFPVFAGTSVRAKALNKWVEERTAQVCDAADAPEDSAGDSVGGEDSVTINVQKLTVEGALMGLQTDVFCPGNAHPDGENKQFIFDRDGRVFAMSDALRTKLAALLRKQVKADDEECESAIADISGSSEISFGVKGQDVVVSIEFAHVIAPCNTSVSIPRAKFVKDYVPDAAMKKAIESL